MNDEIILVGSGGHAKSCVDVIEVKGDYKIAGFIEKNNLKKQESLGYPIIGSDDDLFFFKKKFKNAIVTVGQIKSAEIRLQLFNILEKLEYNLPIIFSPRSHLSKHSKIGNGTILMHDVLVNANTKIGKNCIVNNKSLIEHDVVIGNHCHISTGAIINGNVRIGDKTFIGSGVVIKEGVSVGDNCIIGAGLFLNKDVDSMEIIKND